jgi:hypothetical protein
MTASRTARALILTVAAVSLVACSKNGAGLKTTPPEVRMYAIPAAKVEYTYSGAATGTRSFIFANHGLYERSEDKLRFRMGKNEEKMNQIRINADTVSYVIDLTSKKGQKIESFIPKLATFIPDLKPEEKQNFSEAKLKREGVRPNGSAKVLDHDCKIYEDELRGQRYYVWNGILLKAEIFMGKDTLTMIATSLDEDPDLDASMFAAPKDVEITDLTKQPMLPPGHPAVDESAQGGQQGAAPQGKMPPGHPPVGDGKQGAAPQGQAPKAAMPKGHPPMGN